MASNHPHPDFRIAFSRLFEGWFRAQNCAIACTTYQAGKVFLFGKGENGVSIAERTFLRRRRI